MNSWKSSGLPLCGVAVSSSRFRVKRRTCSARRRRLVFLTSSPARVAESLCASSKTTRSHSWACSSLALQVLVARELVEARDEQVALVEGVAARGRDAVGGEDVEGQVELLVELHLPLVHEGPGRDDQAPLERAADEELADEQAGHDRLAGAGVVGEQVAQGLAREHLLVDRGDLVRQRLDRRGGHGEERVEQVGEVDALRLGDEAEERAVAVEAPGAAGLGDLEAGLAVAVEDLGAHGAVGELVGQLDRV